MRFANNLWTLASKDLRLLFRDPAALFWVLGFPLLFALFFGTVLKAGLEQRVSPLPVAVADEAHTPASQRLLTVLGRSGLALRKLPADAARQSVRRAETVAYLRVPPGFGTAPVAVELGVDPAKGTESAMIKGLLNAALTAVSSSTRSSTTGPSMPDVRLVKLSRTSTGALGGFGVVFPAMILWSLLGCAATFAISMVAERTSGTLVRLRAAPMPRGTILAGKALACFLACLLAAGGLSIVASVLLHVPISNFGKFALALESTAFCFTGITVALSVLGRTEQSVAGAGWATLIVMAMLGGGMVPLSIMPSWFRTLSDASPVKWGILALEGAGWREFSYAELARPIGILLAVGCGCFALGVAVLGRQES
jgi:ABC-2 type transport system permease protein